MQSSDKKKASMQSSTLMFFACMAPNIVAYVDDPTHCANVQANFHNLFDSLARKDHGVVNENRYMLNQDVIQEKQTFDSMKIGLQSAPRRRNNMKEASLRHRRDNLDGNGSPHPAAPVSQTTEISSIQPTEYWRPSSTGSLRKVPGVGIPWDVQRRGNYLYADKSIYLQRLLKNEQGNVFFYITRPRRFGKSSFLSMARHFFNGDEQHFKGLQIHKNGNAIFFKHPYADDLPDKLKGQDWIQCPVVYLDFVQINNFETMAEFKASYFRKLQQVARLYKLIHLDSKPYYDISDLIFELKFHFNLKVVVLIDEYDSPVQNAFVKKKDKVLAEEIRCFIDDLLGSIKGKVDELRLVLVLGVSRLGLTNLQSGPNCYEDLTYNEEFAGAFGFTSTEMADFQPEIADRFNINSKEGLAKLLDQMREAYDGYNFTFQYNSEEKKNVRNPVSTMKCMDKKEVGCYWSETSNVNEVIRRLYFLREPLKAYEHKTLPRADIEARRTPPLESIRIEILMLLYGYLTIESYNEKSEEVVLNFPNGEIKTALKRQIDLYQPGSDVFLSDQLGWLYELRWQMETGHLEGTMRVLQNFFKPPLSETLRQGINEFSVTTRMIDWINAAGIPCREFVGFMQEDPKRGKGGDDVDVFTGDLEKNFIFSVKYGQSAVPAFKAITGYLKDHRTTFLEAINNPDEAWFVGVNFDSRTGGTLHEWVGVLFKNGDLCFDQCKASSSYLCTRVEEEIANNRS